MNAGLATLHFLHGVDRLIVDGSWIVGENRLLPWHAGFLGSEVDAPLDPTLVARLERRETLRVFRRGDRSHRFLVLVLELGCVHGDTSIQTRKV